MELAFVLPINLEEVLAAQSSSGIRIHRAGAVRTEQAKPSRSGTGRVHHARENARAKDGSHAQGENARAKDGYTARELERAY